MVRLMGRSLRALDELLFDRIGSEEGVPRLDRIGAEALPGGIVHAVVPAEDDEVELRVGPDINLGSWTSASPDYAHGDMGDGISPGAMNDYLRRHLGEYSARPQDVAANTEVSLIEDYMASEDILAGYLMATADFGPLRRVITPEKLELVEKKIVPENVYNDIKDRIVAKQKG